MRSPRGPAPGVLRPSRRPSWLECPRIPAATPLVFLDQPLHRVPTLDHRRPRTWPAERFFLPQHFHHLVHGFVPHALVVFLRDLSGIAVEIQLHDLGIEPRLALADGAAERLAPGLRPRALAAAQHDRGDHEPDHARDEEDLRDEEDQASLPCFICRSSASALARSESRSSSSERPERNATVSCLTSP